MILGVIEYARESEDNRPGWCRFRPVYKSEGRAWAKFEDDTREADFPPHGLVYWYASPREAVANSVWVVDAKSRQSAVAPMATDGKARDQFEVDQHSRPHLLIEFGELFDRTDIRRRCATGAFSFPVPPPAPFLVCLPGTQDEWVGPIDPLFEKNSDGLYVGKQESSSGFFDVYHVARDDLQKVRLNEAEFWTLRPQSALGDKSGKFSAQSDEALLSSVLKRIRKLDSNAAEALSITNNVFSQYVQTLDKAGLLGHEVERFELAREEAVRLLLKRINEDSDFLSTVSDTLIARPSVQEAVETAVLAEVQSRAEEIENEAIAGASEATAQVVAKRADLKDVEAQYESKLEKVTELDRNLRDGKNELARLTSDVEGTLREVVDNVLANPVSELAHHVVVRALLETSGSASARSVSPPRLVESPGTEINEVADAKGALLAGASANGQDPTALLRCLASLLAGRLTLLTGLRAAATAELVSRILSGSNRRVVHVPTHIFGLDDLLDLPAMPADPSLEVSPLGRQLTGSGDVDSVACVALRGVNRSPLETAVLDLVEGRGLVDAGPPLPWASRQTDGVIERLAFDPSVILLGTLVDGPSVFKIPRDLRQRISLVWTDYVPKGPPGVRLAAPQDLFVRASTWSNWLNDAHQMPEAELRNILEPMPGDVREACLESELSAFLSVFGGDMRAVGEWLVARFGGLYPAVALDEMATPAGDSARAAVADAHENGTLDRFEQLLDAKEYG